MQIDDRSDWDCAPLEQSWPAASSRGIGSEQARPPQYFLYAEVRRLAAESDEIRRTAVQQTAWETRRGVTQQLSVS